MKASLRTRLLVAVLLTALVALVIVDLATYTLVTRSQLSQVDQDLERSHPPIERAAASAGDVENAIRAVAPSSYVAVRDRNGTDAVVVPLLRPGSRAEELHDLNIAPAPGRNDDDAVFATVRSDDTDGAVRVRVSRQDGGGTLVIGQSLGQVERTRHRLLGVLIAGTIGALVAVAVVGAWLVRFGLRPLTAVERTASEITSTDLDRRVPGEDANTEVGRLATAINTMVDRLHSAIRQREQDVATLAESEERMRRFVADASHELRTPLAATAAYAELFDRGARDRPADLERAMGGIRLETARMAELVDDLLMLAQLDEGRPLAAVPVDLAEVAAEAVLAARVVAPGRRVDLRVNDVPVVTGDPGRLRQVLDNLLANVRAHTPTGTACRVEVAVAGRDAQVSVIDDGPGLAVEQLAKVTERFYRADQSRARRSGGAGLGLSIANSIVDAHGGRLSVESRTGSGVNVTLHLPLTTAGQAGPNRPTLKPQPGDGEDHP